MILLDRGYVLLAATAWYFPVAQLALLLAIAVENLIDMKRISQGKKSITPLNNLFFPQMRMLNSPASLVGWGYLRVTMA